ncbi:MAG: ATP-binding protein [Thermodesulfovibrionales bacterium]|nr:ATP-binding protein [Thermodesulfovibrionales bacterium]
MKYKIFVSGVQKELKEERFAVKEMVAENILLQEHFKVFLFEDSPAKSRSAKTSYIDEVRKCDIYLGILGYEYGAADKNNVSATELEFREVKSTGKDILIYIKGKDDTKRDKRLKKLISEIKDEDAGYKYKRFNTIPELKNNIYESLIDFLREKGIVGRQAFDSAICEDSGLDDIDKEKVRRFLQTAKNQRNFPLSLDAPIKDVLTHLNLLKSGKPTNAAVLLFGKNPHKYFLQAEVKCLHLSGTEVEKPFASYHIYNGDLFEQIDKSVAFVLDAIKLPVIQQVHTAQVKRPYEIPVFAIHEAIVNAVAHRDYNTTAGIQVMVFADRLEIWNSGSLPNQLSLEDLKKPHTSYPNNPLLAGVLYLANYVQKAGSGILEMVKQCKNQGLPEPVFKSIRGLEFRTILARDIFTESVLEKLGLNERQLKAVKYVKEREKITNKEYQELSKDISRITATRDLKDLIEKRIFISVGTGKRDLHYILIKQK